MKKVLTAKKQWSNLNLSDSFLFGEVMQDEETCRTVLEIILKRPIGHLVYVNKEQVMESGTAYHQYKGIRLDVYFKDEENVCYTVEMQNSSQYNLPRRSRHYQSMIDAKCMEVGMIDYTNLCDSIIIFICTFDLFQEELICYTFENTCREKPELKLKDGTLKIFLNTKGKARNEEEALLAEFLHYVMDENSPVESPEVRKIKKRVAQVKQNEEAEAGYMMLMTYIQDTYRDGEAKGEARGKADDILEILSDIGYVPDELKETICQEKDLKKLAVWVKLAARAGSIEEFTANMAGCD